MKLQQQAIFSRFHFTVVLLENLYSF
ncbi:hypothetical protein VCHENC01_3243A, partial [Vibrio harveyi]